MSKEAPSPKLNAPIASPQQRGRLDENLFSEDARRQYAAIKELMDATTAITRVD